MDLAAFRRSRGMTLEQMAEALDLKVGSAGHLSRIENGSYASIPLALKVESWSDGEVTAESLLSPEDADLLARHRQLAAAQPAGVAA